MSTNTAMSEAWLCYDKMQFAQAAQIAQMVLRAAPGNVQAQSCVIMSEVWLNDDVRGALRQIKKLIKRAPDELLLYGHLGALHSYLGALDKAEAAYTKGLSANPDDVYFFYHLTSVKKYTTFDAVCARMQALHDADACKAEDRLSLYAGLAKVYDDLGEYGKAMEFCMLANKERGHKYAPLQQSQHLSALTQLAKSGAFDKTETSGVQSEAPCFIVGMPRSGTTLVETILGRHALVRPCGEMTDIGEIEARLMQGLPRLRSSLVPIVDVVTDAKSENLRAEAENLLQKVADKGREPFRVYTDKMPLNGLKLGLIAKLFPQARIIYVRRNPIDCCISNLFARFAEPYAFSTRQDWLGSYFRYYEDAVAKWSEITGLKVLEVAYEDLVAAPERETRLMLDFLGLEWDNACLDTQSTSGTVRTESLWQARQPINQGSVGRWRRYEPWIQPLIAALGGYEALGETPSDT
jgi:tetratricopeptide (TPR) repeat protein